MLSNKQIINISSVDIPDKDKIEDLDLSQNLICKLSGIESFTSLKSLDLSNNLIKNLDGLEKLIHLERLNLASNLIENEQTLSVLARLPVLRILTLKGNPITQQRYVIVLFKRAYLRVLEIGIVPRYCNCCHHSKFLIPFPSLAKHHTLTSTKTVQNTLTNHPFRAVQNIPLNHHYPSRQILVTLPEEA